MFERERLSFNVLRRDKDALRCLAAAEGEAMAVVVRRLIRKAAREHGLSVIDGQKHSRSTKRQEVSDGY